VRRTVDHRQHKLLAMQNVILAKHDTENERRPSR
jgi:hypothetical protein